MNTSNEPTAIPFAFFCSFIEAIAAIRPGKLPRGVSRRASNHLRPTAPQTFEKWVAELHRRYSPLPPGTSITVFRFLFPEHDIARKYGMQEMRLAQYLVEILGVSTLPDGRGQRLKHWQGEDAQGCLGAEVRNTLEESCANLESETPVSKIDDLLIQLAARCAFSDATVRRHHIEAEPEPSPESRRYILRKLYGAATPLEASVVTQIILKDLRPLLYPLPQDAGHYSAALLKYNSRSYSALTLHEAMRIWDPSGRMLRAYRLRSSIEEAANAYEQPDETRSLQPEVGVPVQIPKCVKGLGCAEALKHFRTSKKVWVETKYDGERAQIHVQLSPDQDHPTIKIYSKSGRNSTLDRAAIHPIICETLGLPYGYAEPPTRTAREGMRRQVSKNIILEAEMVAFSDTLQRVDEFWRIRSLIAGTAIGVRHRAVASPRAHKEDQGTSQNSMISNGSDGGTRHLALVFFDVLFLDDESLLSWPYAARRAVLESIVQLKPAYAMLSERIPIALGSADAEAMLRTIFVKLIADHQEGAVLKADEAQYNDWKRPWVKLKRDYISGHGDTLDLVLVGAAWEKDRARELFVPPTAYTTFYVGALSNKEELKENPTARPHFEVLFTAYYGLSRNELEELNFLIRSSNPVPFASHVPSGLSYNVSLFSGLSPPAVLFGEPVLAEIFGASFTKAPSSKYYELRFPRISKVFRRSERSWAEGTDLTAMQQIAREAVGRDRANKDVDDWCNDIWGKPSSPGAKCPVKRKQTEALWERKLELADAKENGKKTAGTPAKPAKRKGLRREQALENVCGEIVDTARPAKKLKAFNSVTNITTSSATPSPSPFCEVSLEVPSPSIKSRGPSSQVSVRQDKTADAPGQDPPAPLFYRRDDHATPQPKVGLLHHIAYMTSPEDGRSVVPAAAESPTQTQMSKVKLSDFLKNAVVWLVRPQAHTRLSWQPPPHLALPEANFVHGLRAFLHACGWGDVEDGSCPWPERGVIFVDDSNESSGEGWTNYPIATLVARRAALVAIGRTARCKPVLVFSMAMLSQTETQALKTGGANRTQDGSPADLDKELGRGLNSPSITHHIGASVSSGHMHHLVAFSAMPRMTTATREVDVGRLTEHRWEKGEMASARLRADKGFDFQGTQLRVAS